MSLVFASLVSPVARFLWCFWFLVSLVCGSLSSVSEFGLRFSSFRPWSFRCLCFSLWCFRLLVFLVCSGFSGFLVFLVFSGVSGVLGFSGFPCFRFFWCLLSLESLWALSGSSCLWCLLSFLVGSSPLSSSPWCPLSGVSGFLAGKFYVLVSSKDPYTFEINICIFLQLLIHLSITLNLSLSLATLLHWFTFMLSFFFLYVKSMPNVVLMFTTNGICLLNASAKRIYYFVLFPNSRMFQHSF